MFTPEILTPKPDTHFVRELRRIDPDLRVVFGYERYLTKQWAIERRMPPERYFESYSSLLSSDAPRFIEQPIYDTGRPIFDDSGEEIGYEQIGIRRYDLAPEYEWVMFADVLDNRAILELKRTYAWERNHTLSRAAYEKKQREEQEAKETAAKSRRIAAGMDGLEEAFMAHRKKVQFGYGDTRNE